MSKLDDLRKRLRPLLNSIKISLSPNRSSRGGAKPRMSVIHTTESGPGSLWGVVNYFHNAGIEVSSTYVVGDIERKDGWVDVVMCVPENEKPWTQKSANPYSVSYELVGRAARSYTDWMNHKAQLRTVAALVADDCLQYGYPARHGYPGIVGHRDLKSLGFPNDHTDPGENFPWRYFIGLVRGFLNDKGKRPEPVKMNMNKRPRPAGIPRRIPAYAWKYREWHLNGRKGKPPKHPKLPPWFWPWMQWSTGAGPHGRKLP